MKAQYVSIVLLSWALTATANTISEEKKHEAFSYAYNADGLLSKSDYNLVLRLGELGQEWNDATAPLAADLINEDVGAEEWIRRAAPRMVRVNTVLLQMNTTAGMIKDPGAARIASQIADVNTRLRDCWEELARAMANGDEATYQRAAAKIRATGQEKTKIGLPIMSRLREKFGAEASDAAMKAAVTRVTSQMGIKIQAPVSWESINRAMPTDPTIRWVQWSLSSDNVDLRVQHPETGEWVALKYQGSSPGKNSTGKMFFGHAEGGRKVQVTLIGKPMISPSKYEFSLVLTSGSRERILYGDCPDKLKDCFEAQR